MDNNENIDTEELYEEKLEEAEELLEEPDKVEKLLKKLKRKADKLPFHTDKLAFLPKMAMMIRSYIRKEYEKAPVASILAMIAAIAYFVMPFDVIPDVLPVVGMLDDIGVIGLTVGKIGKELEEYMQWRLNTGLDEEEEMA